MTQDASTPLFLPVVTYNSGGAAAVSVAVEDLNGDGLDSGFVVLFIWPPLDRPIVSRRKDDVGSIRLHEGVGRD